MSIDTSKYHQNLPAVQENNTNSPLDAKPVEETGGLVIQLNSSRHHSIASHPVDSRVNSSMTSSLASISRSYSVDSALPSKEMKASHLSTPTVNARRVSTLFAQKLALFEEANEPTSPSITPSTSRRSSSVSSHDSPKTSGRNSLSPLEQQRNSLVQERRDSFSALSNPPDTPPETNRSRRSSSATLFAYDKTGNLVTSQAKAALQAKIPEGTANRLSAWVIKNEATNQANPKRVSYSLEDIPKALEAFKNECQCGWREMKHKWGSDPSKLIPLQIINDLRKMELDEVVDLVKERFPGLEVFNAGSDDLTSDCDQSLKIQGDRGKEIDAVAYYRQVFTDRKWGASTSYIFDNNPYTQSYIENLNNFEHQVDQQNTQNTMSLVMFSRNAGPEKWDNLKSSLLKAAGDSGSKELEKQFVLVESMVHELQFDHNKETMKQGVSEGQATLEDSPEMASQIRRKNPDLVIKVDGKLEIEFKKAVQVTIEGRTKLNANLEKMQHATTPEECLMLYQETVSVATNFMKDEISRLLSQKADVMKEAARIGESSPKKAAPLAEFRADITKNIQLLQEQVRNLSNVLIRDSSLKESAQEWGKINSQIHNIKQKQSVLNDIPLTLHMLNAQKTKLTNSLKSDNMEKTMRKITEVEKKFSDTTAQEANVNILSSELKTKLEELEKNLSMINKKDRMVLEDFLKVSDDMQKSIEINSMKSQCFAQEAHVTSGAVGFVVNDIQMEELNSRNINGYSQAINELMGFYHAHQGHSETPHGKMIEISKYVGPRLMEAYERMELKAESQGLSFPIFKEAETIKRFFNDLLLLRKAKGLTDEAKEALVEKLTKQYNMPITPTGIIDVKAIDQIMVDMHSKVIAWAAKLSPQDKLG